jgi:hypothetical protein
MPGGVTGLLPLLFQGPLRGVAFAVWRIFSFALVFSGFSVGQSNTYPHNAVACERCHNIPRKLGGSPIIVQRVGNKTQDVVVPVAEGGIRHRLGESSENATPTKQITGARVSLNLLGDGLIEAIADEDIARNAESQRQAQGGFRGVTASAPVLETNGHLPLMEVGRFGWKSQHSGLMSSCADSLRNELGVRNRLYPDEYPTHAAGDSPTPFDTPDTN